METATFSSLPEDVFWHILPFLSVRDIFLNISRVEKKLYNFINQNSFKKTIENIFFSDIRVKSYRKAFENLYEDSFHLLRGLVKSGLAKKEEECTRFDHSKFRGLKPFSEEINGILIKLYGFPYTTKTFEDENENFKVGTMKCLKTHQNKGYKLELLLHPNDRSYSNDRSYYNRSNVFSEFQFQERCDTPWYIPSTSKLEVYRKGGITRSFAKYYGGRLEGKMVQESPDLQEYTTANFVDGVIDGVVEIRFKDEKVGMKCRYERGVREGMMEYLKEVKEYGCYLQREPVVGKPVISILYRKGVAKKLVNYEIKREENSDGLVFNRFNRVVDIIPGDLSNMLNDDEKKMFERMDSIFTDFELTVRNNENIPNDNE